MVLDKSPVRIKSCSVKCMNPIHLLQCHFSSGDSVILGKGVYIVPRHSLRCPDHFSDSINGRFLVRQNFLQDAKTRTVMRIGPVMYVQVGFNEGMTLSVSALVFFLN